MKKLLNTLYVLTPESYLFCRNENVCVKVGGEEKISVPAISIDGIVCFGQMTVSTPLIEFCGKHGITLTFLSQNGHFYGRVCGPVSGNVLLRKKQYESLSSEDFVVQTVRSILFGKFRNSKAVLLRAQRGQISDTVKESMDLSARRIGELANQLSGCTDVDSMRGIEGAAASLYFSCFDSMISEKSGFQFKERSRRPPRNEVNAALSFVYTILTREIQSALEIVGLDPAAGYLHTLRPGRPSFALDMLEELRAPLCDRFVLSLVNRGQLTKNDFTSDSQAVMLNEKGRKTVLSAWQKRKNDEIRHPFLDEKVQIGMIPYSQAMLFARVLRGDLDCYPPFVWR